MKTTRRAGAGAAHQGVAALGQAVEAQVPSRPAEVALAQVDAVEVAVDVRHTYRSDLRIELVSPAGTRAQT